jgi:hypothetical protein
LADIDHWGPAVDSVFGSDRNNFLEDLYLILSFYFTIIFNKKLIESFIVFRLYVSKQLQKITKYPRPFTSKDGEKISQLDILLILKFFLFFQHQNFQSFRYDLSIFHLS